MRGLLFLLNALLLLESTDGSKYHQLSQHDKNIIDKAIKLANEKYGKIKHLDLASILEANYDKRMLHVILKPTSCDKRTPSVHREDCEIEDKAPKVSCVDCDGSMSCLRIRETVQIKETVSACLHPPSEHHTGAAHSLFVKAENEQKTGCLGCI